MFDSTEEANSNTKEYNDQQIHDELSYHLKNKGLFNSGRWSDEEHFKFIEGILEYGNDWKRVQKLIKTRSSTQARSHAQKFFSQIKKYLNTEAEVDKGKQSNVTPLSNTMTPSAREGNDCILTKHLLELLSFQDNEKNKGRISKLTMGQKEKLLNTLISLSINSDIAIRKRTGSTGIDAEEENSEENDNDNEEDEIDNIGAVDNSNHQHCEDSGAPYYGRINQNHKIFLIQKDNNKHKYSEPLPYAYKNISNANMNMNKDKDHKMSFHSMTQSKQQSQLKEHSLTPKSKEGDIYNEMKRFFMGKKENNSMMETMPMNSHMSMNMNMYSNTMGMSHLAQRTCGNYRPHSTTNVLDYNWLNNKNFFPTNRKGGECDSKQNTNPFTLNFDCFYNNQDMKDDVNPKTIYEDDNEMMMDVEYNPLGNKL